MNEGVELAEEVVAFREGLDAGTSALLDDFDCMRFLRARQMDVSKAVAMAAAWGAWANTPLPGSASGRTPLTILDDTEDPHEEVYTSKAHCPHCLGGEDKEGRPIYWEQTGKCGVMYKQLRTFVDNDVLFARHIRIQQLMLCRMKALNARTGNRIEKLVVVNDLSHLQMSPDLDGIRYFTGLIGIDQNFFPERLHQVFCINTPWYFTAIYALITPFMDSVTRAKFRLLGKDYYSELSAAIDESNIPTQFGGKMETVW
jgi:hypothetical protein